MAERSQTGGAFFAFDAFNQSLKQMTGLLSITPTQRHIIRHKAR